MFTAAEYWIMTLYQLLSQPVPWIVLGLALGQWCEGMHIQKGQRRP